MLHFDIPSDPDQQRPLLRSLMNVRRPSPISEEFIQIQDEYLKTETSLKGITDIDTLSDIFPGIIVWQGDITTLRCDAIVNAANSQMLGCFAPCHSCIDNCIHTYAGVQLRLECARLMSIQSHEEPTGQAKITPAYNLPSKYVIHTVGPIIQDAPTDTDKALLRSCYKSCLDLAQQNHLSSIAFCCISTGEFHYPNDEAADIAIATVKDFLAETGTPMKVVFNVFKDIDLELYTQKLQSHQQQQT